MRGSGTEAKQSKKIVVSKKPSKDKIPRHEPVSDREETTKAEAKTTGPSKDETEAGPSSVDMEINPAVNDSADDSDEEGDPSKLVHESLLKDGKKKNTLKAKQKYVPSEETPEQRDARTLFIGNVPMEAVTSRVR
jgi:nucleolar protein 12